MVCYYFQCQSYCGVYWFPVWKISSTRAQDKKNSECVPWHTCSCLPLLHLSQWPLVSLQCMAPALKRFFQILVLFSPLLSGVADHPFLHNYTCKLCCQSQVFCFPNTFISLKWVLVCLIIIETVMQQTTWGSNTCAINFCCPEYWIAYLLLKPFWFFMMQLNC